MGKTMHMKQIGGPSVVLVAVMALLLAVAFTTWAAPAKPAAKAAGKAATKNKAAEGLTGTAAKRPTGYTPKGTVTFATSWATFNNKGGDPATQNGAPPYVSQTCFDSLVSVSVDRKWIPALAKTWQIAPGWKYIDFFMRDDVKFSNGDSVTAEDVKYSLIVYTDKKFRYVFGPMWRKTIQNVEIVNPKQVRIHLAQADWGFIGRLWWGGGIMPKAYREKVGDEEFAKHPIGAGPFKWVDYKQDQWALYEAVPNHYRATPHVKTVKLLYVPEPSTRLAMYKNGEADLGPLLGAHIKEIQADPRMKLFWVKGVSGATIIYADLVDPNTPSPFLDIRVRKAACMAIDRESICKKILFGAGEPWGDVLPPVTLGADPKLKPEPYDPEKAKALLTEAGYPNGFETEMQVQTTDITAEALSSNLLDIGIKVKVNKYEAGAFYDNFFQKKFRGLIPYVGWYDAEFQAPAELSDFYLKGTPHAYYTTDEIDAMLRKAMYAETNAELIDWGKKISKLVRDSYITTFLWASNSPFCLGPRIKRWEPSLGCIPAIAFETIELK
jgi:peptide/nickel transport system substrate-binding protein